MITQNQSFGSEAGSWDRFARNYDQQVFSLTSFPGRRDPLLAELIQGHVLNIGCGPTDYLNRDLIRAGHSVVAADFCQAMLVSSAGAFSDQKLTHRLADSRALPFPDNSFENVVSVNSILPPTRANVQQMFSESFRVLKPGGVFVGFLVSFESTLRARDTLGIKIELDDSELRVRDTTGWQCFHSRESVSSEMAKAGFSKISIKQVDLSDRAEIAELKRLYGEDTTKSPIFEHFVCARKEEVLRLPAVE